MEARLKGGWTLSTDHAASSYGQPVLVGPDGAVYGPLDTLEYEGRTMDAWAVVRGMAPLADADARDLAARFVGAVLGPEGLTA